MLRLKKYVALICFYLFVKKVVDSVYLSTVFGLQLVFQNSAILGAPKWGQNKQKSRGQRPVTNCTLETLGEHSTRHYAEKLGEKAPTNFVEPHPFE